MPLTAMVVLAVSLAVAAVLAYELLLEDGSRDIDVVIAREQERFERSTAALVAEARAADPQISDRAALELAVRRFLELNPSTPSYWTIVTFTDGQRLAASNGPPELAAPFAERTLPAGALNRRETLDTGTAAGEIRTSSVPVLLGGERLATLQIVSPLAPVRAEAREAAGIVAAAAGASLLVGGVLLTATLWRALAPLGALAVAARSTELRRFDARVEVPDSDDEVAVLAAEFNTMLDRLADATAEQQRFLASVGHELRTPITIARGHLELLSTLDRGDPAAVTETTEIVRDELGRMGRLVEDLMTFARISTEDFVRPEPLDLVAWFEALEIKLAGTGLGAQVRILPPPPATLQADPDRLAQAVLNLTTNAAVHNPAGTRITIAADLEPQQQRLRIAVLDDGEGIDPAIRDVVLDPFVRAGKARDSTGLGLSVVHAVVTAHGGEVEVDSDHEGTCISLHLPWTPTAEDTDLLGDVPAPLRSGPAGERSTTEDHGAPGMDAPGRHHVAALPPRPPHDRTEVD